MLPELCSLFILAYGFSWCSELWISHSQAVQFHLCFPCNSWIRSVTCYTKFFICKEVFHPVLTIWLGFFFLSVSTILYWLSTFYWMLICSAKCSVPTLYPRWLIKQFHFPQHSSLLLSKNLFTVNSLSGPLGKSVNELVNPDDESSLWAFAGRRFHHLKSFLL